HTPTPTNTSTPLPTHTPTPTSTPTPRPPDIVMPDPPVWPMLVGLAAVTLFAALVGTLFGYGESSTTNTG
nr:hypothetical protein [Anaerolineae bacterium]